MNPSIGSISKWKYLLLLKPWWESYGEYPSIFKTGSTFKCPNRLAFGFILPYSASHLCALQCNYF